MKKISLTISLFFLCTLQSLAQKTISREDFERLVDYANCKYTAGYIEQFRDDENERMNILKYDENVKSFLFEASIEKSLKVNELEPLLKNNGWSNTFNVLTKKIYEKKNKFTGNEMFIEEAIELLKLDGKMGEQLKHEVEDLRTEILTFYEVDKIKKETHATRNVEKDALNQDDNSQIDHLQQQYNDLKNIMKWFGLIALGVLAFFVIVLIFISKKTKGRESIIEIVLNSDRINRKFTPNTITQTTSNVRSNTLTEREINIIVDKVQERLKLNETEIKQPTSQLENIPSTSIHRPVFKYLKGKNGKTFSRAENTPEDSYFRLSNESGDTADFEFFGNDEEAIARRIFHEDICEILTGSYQSASVVKMIMPGKVKRIGEQWSVVERIKIILT